MSEDLTSRDEWSPEQRERAIALRAEIPWGDMGSAIRVFEDLLRMALEATTEPFWREQHVGPELEARGFDECSIPPDTLEGMSDEDRLAHVVRLLRSLALT